MKLRIATMFLTLTLAANCLAAVPYIVVLGTAQDAGVPQMGCDTPFCRRAWANPGLAETVSSIALVDPRSGGRWIFDATPDLPEQFQYLKGVTGDPGNRLDGIFLTHAHIGHYTGLMYLGRESMNASAVRTYAMPRMKLMLEQNAPWSQLVSLRNIALTAIFDKTPVKLADDITVEPFLVPHRDEFSETVGYRITARGRKLIFIPDIDKWEKWPVSLAELVRDSDHLLIDGTFFADGEIARPMSEVPHPFVAETMKLLAGLSKADRAKVIFTHFNHSNPLVQRDKKAAAAVESKGFRIARRGMRIEL
jgi:pyrroloquinoline quinone biosynthesis protein B